MVISKRYGYQGLLNKWRVCLASLLHITVPLIQTDTSRLRDERQTGLNAIKQWSR